MAFMFVTLDVLKFSGWLNARVHCRVERRTLNSLAQEGVWGGGSARGAHAEDPTVRSRLGLHAGGERTRNMPSMVVTLDVSKFAGWLN